MLGGAWPCARLARIQNCEHLYSFLESVKIIDKFLLAATCRGPNRGGDAGVVARSGTPAAALSRGGPRQAVLTARWRDATRGTCPVYFFKNVVGKDMELDAAGRQLEALLPAVFCMAAPV